MPPPGGPLDEVAPWLAAALPESASVGAGPIVELRFLFSEKMDRKDAYQWLEVFPRRTIRSTGWKGAREAVVKLDEPLPADTVVVVELKPGMKDNHGVPQARGRIFVFATGDSIPDGRIAGSLVLEDEPLPGGVVELFPDTPDSVPLIQRPILRRTVADSSGRFVLPWLPADSAGWVLRGYADGNHDRRAGESEPQRVWPDTLRLTADQPALDLGVLTIYKPTTPGRLEGAFAQRPTDPGPVVAFVVSIADQDTGYVPEPQPRGSQPGTVIPDTGLAVIPDAGPGHVRAVFFVDLDSDSLLSAVGTVGDTLWYLEPWALVDSLAVEPGLPTTFPAPIWPDTLTPWIVPLPPDTSVVDSLQSVPPDTLAASDLEPVPSDSLVVPEED